MDKKVVKNSRNNRLKEKIKIRLLDDKIAHKSSNKGKGRYSEYAKAVKRLLPWINENIEERGVIRIWAKDMAKELGDEFKKKSDITIYWSLKYVLFFEGLIVEHAHGDKKNRKGEFHKILVIRKRKYGDKLPKSLRFRSGD